MSTASRRRWGLAAVAFAGSIGVLLSIEGVLRLVTNDPNPGAAEYWSHLSEQLAPCGAVADAPSRSSGTWRIAVVGESSGEYLGDALSVLSRGGSAFEVVSCGKSAASLEQIARRFEEVRATRPDAVLIVLGHNLEKKYPDDRFAVWRQSWVARSRLLSIVAGTRARSQPGNVPVLDRLPLLASFLRHAAEVAKADGFKLSFATVAPNYWLPPFRHPGDARPPPPSEALCEARWLHAIGKRADAIDAISKLEQDGYVSFERGEWLAEAGDGARAREALERAIAFGTNRVVQPTNELLRKVANETGTPLRDMLADAEKSASDGIPGWESVEDNCHLYRALFEVQAARIVQELAPKGIGLGLERNAADRRQPHDPYAVIEHHVKALGRSGADPDGTSGRDYVLRSYELAVFRLMHELGAEAPVKCERALDEALKRTPLEASMAARLWLATAAAEWRAGAKDRARERLSGARAIASSAPLERLDGLWAAGEGRLVDAARSFEKALAIDPSDAESKAYLQKASPR